MPNIFLVLHGSTPLEGEIQKRQEAQLFGWLQANAAPLSVSEASTLDLSGLFGLSTEMALAPLTALGLGFETFPAASGRDWCLASPLHLKPDLGSVLLFGPEALAMSDAEAQALAAAFNAHFEDRGLWLGTHPNQGWLLGSETRLGPRLPSVQVASLDIRALGPEARPWQVLLLEVQMLFHGHEVNKTRQAQGLPTINGLWPEGCGSVSQVNASVGSAAWIKALVAETAWAKGLAQVCDLPLLSLDAALEQGQLWYCEQPEVFEVLLQRAFDWQTAIKGREVWCHLQGQGGWRLGRPGLWARLRRGLFGQG